MFLREKRLDISVQGIDVLQRANALIQVECFDGAALPFSDSSFDVVLLSDVLHHTVDATVLLREARRVAKHILIKDLPEQDRFSRLRAEKKHFIDTVKLIAYRAETAMAHIAREKMARIHDARALMRQLYRSEVDLIPDHKNKNSYCAPPPPHYQCPRPNEGAHRTHAPAISDPWN